MARIPLSSYPDLSQVTHTPRALTIAVTFLCLAAALAPFLVPHIPVGTDLSDHVLVANIIDHYHDQWLAYDKSFDIVVEPRATVLGELCLALFARFLDPYNAAKAYLLALVLGLWLGGVYLMRSVHAPPLCGVLLIPLAHTFCVFAGALPYAGSMVFFPFLLGVLIAAPYGVRRTTILSVLLLLSYGFHIVGAAVGCFAICIFIILDGRRRPRAWLDLIAVLPTAALVFSFVARRDTAGSGAARYYGPIGQIKAWLAYNAWTLSRVAGVVFLIVFFALAAFTAIQVYRKRTDLRLIVVAGLLAIIGLVLPYQLGDWFVVGSRTLPFVVMALLAAVPFSHRSAATAAALATAFLVISAVGNTSAALRVQPLYAEFFSGMQTVQPGSRILLIGDRSLGGNMYIHPLANIESAYNVYRGGSNPYCLASPPRQQERRRAGPAAGGTLTGAPLLRYKYYPLYAYKYSGQLANYVGVGRVYDYVLLYAASPAVQASIAAQGERIFMNGRLSIYRTGQSSKAIVDDAFSKVGRKE